MYIHKWFKTESEVSQLEQEQEEQSKGLLERLSGYLYSPKKFFYNLGGFELSLEEIKHGLLRNNMKEPGKFWPYLSAADVRLTLLEGFMDPRILLVCIDLPEFVECIDSFKGATDDDLDKELDNYAETALESAVNFDLDQNEIQLPKMFQKYIGDFQSNVSNVIEFVLRY